MERIYTSLKYLNASECNVIIIIEWQRLLQWRRVF